jgi:mycothiol synthase
MVRTTTTLTPPRATGSAEVPAAEVERLSRLAPQQIADVVRLVDEVTLCDGVSPLSEHVLLHLRAGGDAHDVHLLARDAAGSVIAYAHLDTTDVVAGGSAELAVLPSARRRGVGRMLVEQHLIPMSPRLRLWAHGRHSGSDELARAMGFHRVRELLQMRRSLLAPLPEIETPPDVRIRTFLPSLDDNEWVHLNAAAFVDLPDQGSWDIADLRLRMSERWFDPAGFFVAERDGRMAGFHWTKVHGGGADHAHAHTGDHGDHPHDHLSDGHPHDHGHSRIGEVYVIAVDPDLGRGLGAPLLLTGLRHLRGLGLTEAMLYVDSSNLRAIDLYQRLGFVVWDRDVQYSAAPVGHREVTRSSPETDHRGSGDVQP